MKDVVNILQDLVRIPSASSISNRGVVEYARSALHHAGWNTITSAYVDASGAKKISLIAAPPGQSSEEPGVDRAFLCHYVPDGIRHLLQGMKRADPDVLRLS